MGRLDKGYDAVDSFHRILHGDHRPEWLRDYILTDAMRRHDGVSTQCGMNWSPLFNYWFFYTSLEHQIGTANIVWYFTHDKRATLAALFHDIAAPAFKHVVDLMCGDYKKQESTESRTAEFIRSSKEIYDLLERDQIALDDVVDYKKYPIADNEMPRLSADRLEYTFSYGIISGDLALDYILSLYSHLIVVKNEDLRNELAFSDKQSAHRYVDVAGQFWLTWYSAKNRGIMRCIADCLTAAIRNKIFEFDDLWKLSEFEIAEQMEHHRLSSWLRFQEVRAVVESDDTCSYETAPWKFTYRAPSKPRWTDPLFINEHGDAVRISSVLANGANPIADFLKYEPREYVFLL
ncbi:MAG: hypothetical protein LBK50_03480 [Candidatus Nomurabacteria bacterium]|jgi:hypothetical protein|nr:hypothetical protein [Candidatus Nomurabacteria bacterium]